MGGSGINRNTAKQCESKLIRYVVAFVTTAVTLLIAIPIAIYFYKLDRFHARKASTHERLASGEDYLVLTDEMILAIEQSTQATLQRPEILFSHMFSNYHRDGWVFCVSWFSDEPMASGLRINFANGTSAEFAFNETVLAHLNDRTVSSYVYLLLLTESNSSVLSRELSPKDVISACLLADDQPISDPFNVNTSFAEPRWKKDERK